MRRASLRADAISKKFVFILYPFFLFAVRKTMHGFSFTKRASAQKYAPALGAMPYQKNLCSFCLLSCWLLENVMHGFSFTKRASAQNTRARAGSLKSLHFIIILILLLLSFIIAFFGGIKGGAWVRENPHLPLWNAVLKSLPPEPPHRATFPLRLFIKKFFISIIYLFQFVQFKRSFFMDFF